MSILITVLDFVSMLMTVFDFGSVHIRFREYAYDSSLQYIAILYLFMNSINLTVRDFTVGEPLLKVQYD